jgi:ribose transport system ATP-binding protein
MSLHLTNITKHFTATRALDGVDLSVEAGEVHALIGENGAGKSTLLNILSGQLPPTSGAMQLGGAAYAPDDPREARARGVAHIHQELALCPHLTVAENILLGAEGSRVRLRRHELSTRAARLLADFGRGDIDPLAPAGRLSLADRQVVEICRALAWDAKLILMDEPTSSLQRANVERLFALIRRLRARGIAVVYVSHFLEEVREIADRFTVLRDGKSIAGGNLHDVTDDALITAMVGRERDPPLLPGEGGPRAQRGGRVRASAIPADIILEVRDLASPPRLKSASFELRRGEVLGIAGLIGSGRTDLIRTIFGLQRATAGTIRTKATLGYLSEDRKGEGLAMQLSVADNVTMSRLASVARAGWIDRRRQEARSVAVMQQLRIKAAGAWTRVGRLSGGNQQKVAFGRLLHHDADILLLDEPARGIDIGSKSDIYAAIDALAAAGKSMVMVSSYLPELFVVCDRIAVMSRGRLSEARPAAEWTSESVMEAAIGSAA